MTTRKAGRRNEIILLAVTLLVCFAVLEIAVRSLWNEYDNYGYPYGLHIADKALGYRYAPGFAGFFPGREYGNIEIRINSQGLRDYEHEFGKSQKLRILGLGDSVTFGSGVSYSDTYLSQLEEKLIENGYDAEVIKAGVNGYEFEQEYTYYLEEGYKYEPDIVILGVVLNDPKEPDIDALYKIYSERDPYGIKTVVGNCCKLCKFAYTLLQDSQPTGADHDDAYFERVYELWQGETWESYRAKLMDFNNRLKSESITLVLVVFPYTQQFENSLGYGTEPQERLRIASETNGIIFIDLMKYLDTEGFERYYLANDKLHLKAEGHAVVSDAIYEVLTSKNLLKRQDN
jgi:lysophospholipase L1-like esterase